MKNDFDNLILTMYTEAIKELRVAKIDTKREPYERFYLINEAEAQGRVNALKPIVDVINRGDDDDRFEFDDRTDEEIMEEGGF